MKLDSRLALVAHPDGDTLADVYSLLDARGYSVATRASVVETLKFVSARKPDVVLCGEGMESFQGSPLPQVIRHASPETRVVILPGDVRNSLDGLRGSRLI